MQSQMIRGWIVGLLAVFAILVGGSPAGAHAELESSDPKDGETLSSAPAAISFVFGEEILPEGNAVTLTDVAADTRLEVGPVEVEGDTVSVAWPSASPAGEFRAAYRVVSADGHPIDGTITFTVEQAVGGGGGDSGRGDRPAPRRSSPQARPRRRAPRRSRPVLSPRREMRMPGCWPGSWASASSCSRVRRPAPGSCDGPDDRPDRP